MASPAWADGEYWADVILFWNGNSDEMAPLSPGTNLQTAKPECFKLGDRVCRVQDIDS